MSDRRYHPQVIRAKELTREAGLDLNPYARVPERRFMDAAFDEHFQRTAIDNIYWDQGRSADRWRIPHHYAECHFYYGRCKSGRRWFWHISGWVWARLDDNRFAEHGWADSEEQALIDGTAAIKRLAAGRRVITRYVHQFASQTLKEINHAKRVKGWTDAPANGSDSHATEYLYDQWGGEFRITKKTAKRIYYVKGDRVYRDDPPKIGFAPRHRVANDWPGPTWSELRDLQDKLGYRNAPEFFLKPRPSGWFDRGPPPKTDLRELKAAMAAAHPDKGGSNAAFIAAREAYVRARRMSAQRDDGS